jgi:hypothetical protein
LNTAAQVGLEIAQELLKIDKQKAAVMSRYRTLILGLTKNKELKNLLVKRQLVASKFVRMSEMELASDEISKEFKEREAFQAASKRSDAILEY